MSHILAGNRLDNYVAHVRQLLDLGVPLEGTGVQGHSHGETIDIDTLRHALDALNELQLPIHRVTVGDNVRTVDLARKVGELSVSFTR